MQAPAGNSEEVVLFSVLACGCCDCEDAKSQNQELKVLACAEPISFRPDVYIVVLRSTKGSEAPLYPLRVRWSKVENAVDQRLAVDDVELV
jgi:hypothetical protein